MHVAADTAALVSTKRMKLVEKRTAAKRVAYCYASWHKLVTSKRNVMRHFIDVLDSGILPGNLRQAVTPGW